MIDFTEFLGLHFLHSPIRKKRQFFQQSWVKFIFRKISIWYTSKRFGRHFHSLTLVRKMSNLHFQEFRTISLWHPIFFTYWSKSGVPGSCSRIFQILHFPLNISKGILVIHMYSSPDTSACQYHIVPVGPTSNTDVIEKPYVFDFVFYYFYDLIWKLPFTLPGRKEMLLYWCSCPIIHFFFLVKTKLVCRSWPQGSGMVVIVEQYGSSRKFFLRLLN